MNIYIKVFEDLLLTKKHSNKINTQKNKIRSQYDVNNTSFQLVCDEYHQFFSFILNLKNIPRSGWSSKANIKDPESVAEHTYSLCLIAMLFSDLFGFKTERVIKMALLHALAETIIGDYTPEEISTKEKVLKEHTALKKIFGLLPKKLRSGNNDSQHIDKTACVRHARNDGLTEETEQPVSGQRQDHQLKHGNLLYEQPWRHPVGLPG